MCSTEINLKGSTLTWNGEMRTYSRESFIFIISKYIAILARLYRYNLLQNLNCIVKSKVTTDIFLNTHKHIHTFLSIIYLETSQT